MAKKKDKSVYQIKMKISEKGMQQINGMRLALHKDNISEVFVGGIKLLRLIIKEIKNGNEIIIRKKDKSYNPFIKDTEYEIDLIGLRKC